MNVHFYLNINLLIGEKMESNKSKLILKIFIVIVILVLLSFVIYLIVIGLLPEGSNKDYCDDDNGCTVGGKNIRYGINYFLTHLKAHGKF